VSGALLDTRIPSSFYHRRRFLFHRSSPPLPFSLFVPAAVLIITASVESFCSIRVSIALLKQTSRCRSNFSPRSKSHATVRIVVTNIDEFLFLLLTLILYQNSYY
jgi:hypothetical protein